MHVQSGALTTAHRATITLTAKDNDDDSDDDDDDDDNERNLRILHDRRILPSASIRIPSVLCK